jgi:hypothetical protein
VEIVTRLIGPRLHLIAMTVRIDGQVPVGGGELSIHSFDHLTEITGGARADLGGVTHYCRNGLNNIL